MGEAPGSRQGLIPMLVAIRVAGERKRRQAAAEAAAAKGEPVEKSKKKRGWFG